MSDNDELARMYRAPSARVEDFGPPTGRPKAVWLAVGLEILNLVAGFAVMVFLLPMGSYLFLALILSSLPGPVMMASTAIPITIVAFIFMRRDWARWTWVGLSLVSWLTTFYNYLFWNPGAALIVAAILLVAVDAIVGCLLLSKSARHWFETKPLAEEAVV